MTLIPHRTVASQIAVHLREEIAKGTWREWLPGERSLCQLAQASRNSVRAALEQLRAEGIIVSTQGVGNRVVAVPRSTGARTRLKTVGVLIPEPIGSLRPLIALWIDQLKDLLLAEQCRLRVHAGRRHYLTNGTKALERLVAQNPYDAWVLTLSSEPMQRWFVRRGLPCLVAGSTYADVDLPFLDFDYRAICRHAAAVLLRLGHRRVGLLNRESRRAGDVDSEAGFAEGVRSSRLPDATIATAYHQDDVESVSRALARLMDRKHRPTALLVSNSYAYAATATLLAQRGLRIPADMSLISRDDDPFLAALAPAPARYVVSPHAFAKKMLPPLLQLVNGEPVVRRQERLLPRFVAGGSIAPPAA